jgi:hypothetical protein
MAITKIYKGTNDVTSSFLKAYKGETEIYTSTPPIPAYLTFQSTSNFDLYVWPKTKHWDGTLYYSTDLETWHEWDGTTTLRSVGKKLYLRGMGNTIITGDSSSFVLSGSNIECIGNIETLLDWETVALGNHPTMAANCFFGMFNICTKLTTAPSLPATTLADSCYRGMFSGCTGLTTAPELPATTLADSCYRGMFSGCTGLTTAPSLPATTLTDMCYYHMFKGCTGLTTAPSLPATTLADYCYYYMFNNCTSLTTVPNLPATTLTDSCYYGMFYGCSTLKVSTTKTGSYKYSWRIPTSGTGTEASSWNTGMLTGTGGTFKSNPSINTTYYVENPPV